MHWLLTTILFLSMGSSTIPVEKHPIYTSMTEIDYKPNRKALEISVKIYADDLERLLTAQKGEKIELGTDREHPKATTYLLEYLNRHLKLKVDNKAVKYNFVGRENGGRADMFAMYIFIEVLNVEPFESIQVDNSILIEELSTQLNFIACHTTRGLIEEITRKEDTFKNIKW